MHPDSSSHIVTAYGRVVDPLALRVEDIAVEDLAHHLGNQCRFSGAVRKFYSVAEHSVRVTKWVRAHGGSIEECRWALMHDAPEAYLQDMPKPLKENQYFGKAYRGAEARAMAVICERFGLPTTQPEIVHEGDKALFMAERRDLMPKSPQWLLWKIPEHIEVPEHEVRPWGPAKATRKWLELFVALFVDG